MSRPRGRLEHARAFEIVFDPKYAGSYVGSLTVPALDVSTVLKGRNESSPAIYCRVTRKGGCVPSGTLEQVAVTTGRIAHKTCEQTKAFQPYLHGLSGFA
jgi:hypothetical protein